jgi:hypothetical protein
MSFDSIGRAGDPTLGSRPVGYYWRHTKRSPFIRFQDDEASKVINPAWMTWYNEIKAFKSRNGHLKIPLTTRLAKWIYRRDKAKLGIFPEEQKKLLDRNQMDDSHYRALGKTSSGSSKSVMGIYKFQKDLR